MAAARDYNTAANGRNTEATADRVKDRTQVQRFLSEVGLNPGDYIFSPLPEDNPSQGPISQHTSAFSNYPSQQKQDYQQVLKPQSQVLFTSGRPSAYVQQPPPLPSSSSQSSANQPSQPFPNQTSPPQSNNQQQGSPPQLNNQQQGPPPPSSSQQGSTMNRSPPSPLIQNLVSKSPYNLSQQILSPRRSPPDPPGQFNSGFHDSSGSAEHYLRQINSHEVPPVKVVKPSTQNVVYRKEIRIRYLQPPTPPPPAPIIIREKHIPPKPPQSPLLIRERKPEAHTPPPLTIRERPPSPPAPIEPYIIEKNLPPPPPQPRQIIIERLPTPPPKPRAVIFEKWLPYKKLKRPVLLQKAPPADPIKPTRNVIIEYEPLKAFTVRRVIEEGVFRVDPHQYSSYNAKSHGGSGDVRIVERIEDLPPPSEQLLRVLNEYSHSDQHHSPMPHDYHQQSHHNSSEHIPSAIQRLFPSAQSGSNIDQLTNISRASNTPAYRQDRVSSSVSSDAGPIIIPLQRSRSKASNHQLNHYTPHDSPIRSHIDDVY